MTDTNKTSAKLTGSEPLATRKKEEFCKLYVTSTFFPGAIYRQAGYKPSSDLNASKRASALLREPEIKARINFLRKERDERIGRNAESVVEGLFQSRDRCSEGSILRDRQGKPITIDINVKGVNLRHAVVWKYDVTGFHKASELLARYFGILTDKVIVDDKRVLAEQYDNEAEDILTTLDTDKQLYTKYDTKHTNKDSNIQHIDDTKQVDELKKKRYVVVDSEGVEHKVKPQYHYARTAISRSQSLLHRHYY